MEPEPKVHFPPGATKKCEASGGVLIKCNFLLLFNSTSSSFPLHLPPLLLPSVVLINLFSSSHDVDCHLHLTVLVSAWFMRRQKRKNQFCQICFYCLKMVTMGGQTRKSTRASFHCISCIFRCQELTFNMAPPSNYD